MTIADRLGAIRERIEGAAKRAGRPAGDIELIAVSKFQPIGSIEAAFGAGQRAFGENRVQEAEEKALALAALRQRGLTIDLIGNLQSNKVRKAVASVSRIQSIDSAELGERVARAATDVGIVMPILVQADLAGEDTKHGVPESELFETLERLARASGIRVAGLMLLPPLFENPDDARPYFRRLRLHRDEAVKGGLLKPGADLSMGMSHDFEVAIEEGATIVRVGTAIFGERPRT